MDENEVREAFGSDYKETTPNYIDDTSGDWERFIELKLSNQGKMIVGVGVVVLGTLVLTVLQGKVTITLVKAHKTVVDTLNSIIAGGPGGPNNPSSVSYSKPQGAVDESKIEPINQEELDELSIRMEASTKGTDEEIQ